MTNVVALRNDIQNAITARLASAKAQSMTSSNRAKLEKVNLSDPVVTVLLACNYDPSNVNQNVYSVEKAFDIAACAAKGGRMSVYCDATFRSMLALEKAEIEVTRDVIASFCSNDVKTKYDAKIKATRVQTTKSQSTVATQHNSTINAMLALHMLNAARNASNDEVFTINRENEAVKQIAAIKEIAL